MNLARVLSVLEKWLKLALKLNVSDTSQDREGHDRDRTAWVLRTV